MNIPFLQKTLNLALVAAALWYALAFTYVAVFSFGYPFGMEWLEGHVMEIVARSAENKPIYVAPMMDYVPFIYTPFYYHAAAIFTHIFGVDFTAGRALSILCTFGISAVLFSWSRLLGGSRTAAFAASGLYFATYQIMGRWYDLARIDNLYILLMLSGLYVTVTQRGAVSALVGAGLLAFAFYTKQSALLACLPVLVWALVCHRRDGMFATVATACCVVLIVLISDALSGGWFSFYVFSVPAGHGLEDKYILGFFSGDLIRTWWPMLAVAIALALHTYRHERALFWEFTALAAGLIGSSYISRIHWGGYVNVLIPMAAFFALVAGAAIARWWPAKLLVLLQFVLLYYPPNDLIPNDALLETNEKAIEAITTSVDGDIYIPELHFIHWPVGKKSHVYGMAAFDIFRSSGTRVDPVKAAMRKELEEAFARKAYAGVMPGALMRLREANEHYSESSRLYPTFRYQTGLVRQQNPTLLQLPK